LALYGEPLEVEFLARLRDVTTFTSKDQLIEQLKIDIQASRVIVQSVSDSLA
jgi:FAD synthase